MRYGIHCLQTVFLGIFCISGVVHAGIHIDMAAGYSLVSKYTYFDRADTLVQRWIDFTPANGASFNGSVSLDIYKTRTSLGVYSGFIRRFDLFPRVKNSAANEKPEKIGEILSIPIIGFIEDRFGPLFYRCGAGPFITRFNYFTDTLPEFEVHPMFGFLFGAGYCRKLINRFELLVQSEVLVNAPAKLYEYLFPTLQKDLENAVNQRYNRYDYVSVIYNYSVCIGLRYSFSNGAGALGTGGLFSLFSTAKNAQ